jgi:uncharacterized protein with HEPN domain
MQRDDTVYLGHMLDVARSIRGRMIGLSQTDYHANEDLRLALAHLIQTIGEAARRVSPDSQRLYPQIPWKGIIGMRHKIVHDYLEVDFDMVWDVATVEIPPLLQQLEKIVPDDSSLST